MTEHSMHLVYTPKLIFISFYCHFLWSLCDGVLVVCYICGHVDCPYSHNAIIIHFIHVALFSASPYILLYFIEIISLLSFPFYLYNAYILFAFISMFRSVLLFVYVCVHVCVVCDSDGEGGEAASGSKDCYQIVLKHSMRIHMHCKSITLFSFCEIDFCVYVKSFFFLIQK